MKAIAKAFGAAAILFAGVAALAPSPGASSEHFVITNNCNLDSAQTGTILKLDGTRENPVLKPLRLLKTGAASTGGFVEPTIQLVRNGSDICLFLSSSDYTTGTNNISAFVYPSMKFVGNFSNPNVPSAAAGMALSARNGYLYAGSSGYNDSYFFATWQINSSCVLTLVNTVPLPQSLNSIDVTPDGKTLLVSYQNYYIDSFSIGAGGTLTEHGPYGFDGVLAFGIDATADSQVAFFSIVGYGPPDDQYTDIAVYPINADGSLGQGENFGGDGSLGMGYGGGWIWLSPNEKFLFSNDMHQNVTSLFFSESPLRLGFVCKTVLRPPHGNANFFAGTMMATASPTGAGGALYVPEGAENEPETVALLKINPTTGCATEVPASPFNSAPIGGGGGSAAAWPSRPF